MTKTQPEALNLEEFRAKVTRAAREPLLARIAELEAVLSAMGEKGNPVEPADIPRATDQDTHFFLAGWNGRAAQVDPHEHFRNAAATAPAYPAEGVPAPVTVVDALQSLIEAIQFTPLGVRQIHAMESAREALAATHPTQQMLDARQWLQQHDFEALERFAETSEDDESYDIGKEAIQRLTHFGCLNSHGFGRYSITSFGSYVLDNWSLARELPFKMQSERDAEHRAALAAQAKQGGQANG